MAIGNDGADEFTDASSSQGADSRAPPAALGRS
jgi:hypothetical protein